MARRENTFRIDLANIPKRPSYEEIHTFVSSELGLQREQVLRIQCSRSANCVFVKVVDLGLAQKVCEEHDEKHEVEVDGEKYVLRIRMEDGAVEVKLFDLPEDISEQNIIGFLQDFGEVLSIREQMWTDQYTFGGTSTGVWIARMIVKRNIPSYVTIDGETTYLSYYGQLQSCKHCGEYVHNGASCVQNKKLLIQKMTADQGSKQSYASVAKKPAKPRAAGKSNRPTLNEQSTTLAPPLAPQQITATKNTPTLAPTTSSAIKQPSVSIKPIPTGIFKKPNHNNTTTQQHHHHQSGKQIRSNDGEETDESTSSSTSRRSRRHTDKKPRYDDGEISLEEGMSH